MPQSERDSKVELSSEVPCQSAGWGQPRVPKTSPGETPGPGWYEVDLSLTQPGQHQRASRTALSSCFVSETARKDTAHTPASRGAPGPAYYKPETNARKSFLLNTSHKWL